MQADHEDSSEIFLISGEDCFIATGVKIGGGTIFTDPQPDCTCEGGIHKKAHSLQVLTMVLSNPEGKEQVVTIPIGSAFAEAILDMDLYYHFKRIAEDYV